MIKLLAVALLLTVSVGAWGASSGEPAGSPAVGARAVLEDRYPVRAIVFQGDCSKETLQAASAAHFADARSPPALLVHGGNDHTVPTQQSRDFSALLQSKGLAVEYLEIPGVDHSFIGTTADATRAASLKALQTSFAFIDRTVGQSRTADRP